ncbi:MAG: hypothetical protein ACOCZ5_00730 [bacterium]
MEELKQIKNREFRLSGLNTKLCEEFAEQSFQYHSPRGRNISRIKKNIFNGKKAELAFIC